MNDNEAHHKSSYDDDDDDDDDDDKLCCPDHHTAWLKLALRSKLIMQFMYVVYDHGYYLGSPTLVGMP